MNRGEVCEAEPTGFGAVVITPDGEWWVSINHSSVTGPETPADRWRRVSSPGPRSRLWSWADVVGTGTAALVCTGVEIPLQWGEMVDAQKEDKEFEVNVQLADGTKIKWAKALSSMTSFANSFSNNITTSSGTVAANYLPPPPANADWEIAPIDMGN